MRVTTGICLLVFALPVLAQNPDFEKFRQQQRASFEQFRDDQQDKYDAFRQQVNAQYAEFMRKAWAEFPVREADVPIKEEVIAPVEYEETDSIQPVETEENRQPQFSTNWSLSFRSSTQPEKKQPSSQQSRQIVAVWYSDDADHLPQCAMFCRLLHD